MESKLLNGKNILLGVTGSIAIYKSIELLRLLTKSGANVKVVLSDGARRFISPLLFEALTQNSVITSSSESWANEDNHIHIHKWADLFCIAPATANSINKIGNGIADNLLTQMALASSKPYIIAPAANSMMITHPQTVKSLKNIEEFGNYIINPEEKELACKDVGIGALAHPEFIFWQIVKNLYEDDSLRGKNIVVTGGGTKETIDEVRYISNYSSGKMANSLALALSLKGANVTLLTSSKIDTKNYPFKTINYKSSFELNEKLTKLKEENETLFMAAAVSDFLPKDRFLGKLKKRDLGSMWSLELTQNVDILKNMSKLGFNCIGFKAEMDEKNAHKSAERMLKEKNLSAVCLNILKDKDSFGTDLTKMEIFTKNGWVKLPKSDKLTTSFKIIEHIF